MIKVFISYAHPDEAYRIQLEKHLSLLKRSGYIDTWTDREIIPGTEWDKSISHELSSADIILLLISADFLASDYCYDEEMNVALARHRNNEAKVIPIVVRHCDWKSSPFASLQGLPRDGRPIKNWPDNDEAYLNVVEGLKKTINDLKKKIGAVDKKVDSNTKSSLDNVTAIERDIEPPIMGAKNIHSISLRSRLATSTIVFLIALLSFSFYVFKYHPFAQQLLVQDNSVGSIDSLNTPRSNIRVNEAYTPSKSDNTFVDSPAFSEPGQPNSSSTMPQVRVKTKAGPPSYWRQVILNTYPTELAAIKRKNILITNGNNAEVIASDASTFLVVMYVEENYKNRDFLLDSLTRMFNPKGVRFYESINQ